MPVFETIAERARAVVSAAFPSVAKKDKAPAASSKDLTARATPSGITDDWVLALQDKIEPRLAMQILRGALMGDHWRQVQLTSKMLDSWPMFRKCAHELRSAVASVKYTVKPYAEHGEDPSDTAIAKADTVTRAIKNFEPDRFEDEEGYSGLIYDIADMVLNGISVNEIQYHQVVDPKGGKEWLPRASSWVHPKNFSISYNGRININAQAYDPTSLTSFPSRLSGPQPTRQEKFIIGKFKSKSGSFLANGHMRCLVYEWCTVMYGRDFMLAFAQKYGGPFMQIPYQSGIPQEEIDKFEAAAKRASNLNYIVYPTTGMDKTEVKITPAQSMSGDNPQVVMMRLADEHCQMLLLGQTLTSAAPVNGGTRAQGEVHEGVRRGNIESLAVAVANILTQQLAKDVVRLNYGEGAGENPEIVADFTETEDPAAAATRWSTLLSTGQPFDAEEFYDGVGAKMPEDGGKVVIGGMGGGKLGKLGNTDYEVGGEPQAPEPGFDQFGNPQEPGQFGGFGGEGEGQETYGGKEDEESLYARHMNKLRRVMAKASDEDLEELRGKLIKAQSAADQGHLNGEWQDVAVKVRTVEQEPRIKL